MKWANSGYRRPLLFARITKSCLHLDAGPGFQLWLSARTPICPTAGCKPEARHLHGHVMLFMSHATVDPQTCVSPGAGSGMFMPVFCRSLSQETESWGKNGVRKRCHAFAGANKVLHLVLDLCIMIVFHRRCIHRSNDEPSHCVSRQRNRPAFRQKTVRL